MSHEQIGHKANLKIWRRSCLQLTRAVFSHCRAYMFSAKGALSCRSLGHRPREFSHPYGQALKARFSCRTWKRTFSGGGFCSTDPGASPQVRHGESVLWRTGNETAPLALTISYGQKRGQMCRILAVACAVLSAPGVSAVAANPLRQRTLQHLLVGLRSRTALNLYQKPLQRGHYFPSTSAAASRSSAA